MENKKLSCKQFPNYGVLKKGTVMKTPEIIKIGEVQTRPTIK